MSTPPQIWSAYKRSAEPQRTRGSMAICTTGKHQQVTSFSCHRLIGTSGARFFVGCLPSWMAPRTFAAPGSRWDEPPEYLRQAERHERGVPAGPACSPRLVTELPPDRGLPHGFLRTCTFLRLLKTLSSTLPQATTSGWAARAQAASAIAPIDNLDRCRF
jgi:hypothetical protein